MLAFSIAKKKSRIDGTKARRANKPFWTVGHAHIPRYDHHPRSDHPSKVAAARSTNNATFYRHLPHEQLRQEHF